MDLRLRLLLGVAAFDTDPTEHHPFLRVNIGGYRSRSTWSLSPFLTSMTASIASGALTDIRDAGAGQSFGTAFVGTYVHDDAPQAGLLIEPGRQLCAGGQFGVSTSSLALLGGTVSELQVFNDWTNTIGGYNQDDGYFVSSRVYDANGVDFFLIQFDMWDFAGATLTSLDMPPQAQFTQLATHGRVWIRRFEAGVKTGVASGGFSSMVSSVPEPTTLFLLAGGLASLSMARRRSRGFDAWLARRLQALKADAGLS
jgi:hypothetical protein